jgi:arylsulfatase A-like enzyme
MQPARLRKILIVCFVLLASGTIQLSAEEPSRPNIIVIMSDDMGYSDIGCYGGEIETPTLNGLAEGGLRFTQFYNTARCCPTRASLLSGLYPHQAGIGHMTNPTEFEGYQGELNRRCVTIAEALQPAGYRTYMVGKWHVTTNWRADDQKFNWPLQRGFDKFYGTIMGAGSFWDPATLTRGNTQIAPESDPDYSPDVYFYTDAISDNAAAYIDQHAAESPDDPFFMYVAYTAAHWPMHAKETDIAKYKGRYDEGYGAIREERYARAVELGVIRDSWELSPQAGDWKNVQNREWELRCMEVYAAMVDSMDQGIGRIVDALQRNEQYDDTLIFFLQDNGGCAEGFGRRPRGGITERPNAPTYPPMTEGELQTEMAPTQTRDGYPVVMGPGIMPGPADTYIGYGEGWANVSNTPFREYKHWTHEGGISTPLIAHWPAGIQRHGELEHQPGHLIDIMATCVDVSGAAYPESKDGMPIRPMEGRSLQTAFVGETIEREGIFWEHEGNRAIRVGPWKMVAKGAEGSWELYNIDEDRSEMHDLSAEQSERVAEFTAMWNAYAERSQVLPLTPYWDPQQETFSNRKTFRLGQGSDLARPDAPMIEGRTVEIGLTLSDPAVDGVILAQGGSQLGYVLYVQDGRLQFATQHAGNMTIISASEELPSRETSLFVRYAKNGRVTIQLDVNGPAIASGRVPGMIVMPIDGLQVGYDAAGLVGDYGEDNAYPGEIKDVVVRLID